MKYYKISNKANSILVRTLNSSKHNTECGHINIISLKYRDALLLNLPEKHHFNSRGDICIRNHYTEFKIDRISKDD